MRYPDQPWFLLDENTGAPSGGAPAPAGGGASAPAPSAPPGGGATSPPEGAEAAPPEPASGGHDPFDGMESNDYYDSVEIGAAGEGTGDEPGPVPATPAGGVEGEPKPATPAPSAVPQVPVPPTAPSTPAPDVTTPPRSTLEQTLESFKNAANQTALSDWASQNLFKLSEADVEGLNTDAAGTVQKLMGRTYMHCMQSAANLIKNLVPEMVNSGITTQQARTTRANEALSEFYQANPHLSADQHGSAVDRWARSFRAMNPQASRADAIAFVGKAVSAEFGVWPGQNGSGQAAPARRAAPFAPARQGGRAPASQKGPHDPYAGMEDEYD